MDSNCGVPYINWCSCHRNLPISPILKILLDYFNIPHKVNAGELLLYCAAEGQNPHTFGMNGMFLTYFDS